MNLYQLASKVQTAKALSSGDPQRVARRAKNVAVAKGLGKVGFWRVWRRLWR